jgi:hypothetical protein
MTNGKIRKQIEAVQELERRIPRLLLRQQKRRSRVKSLARKERDDRVIGLGRLAWIAGLLHVDGDVLLGALLAAGRLRSDPAWREKWRRDGEVATTNWEEGGEKSALAAEFRRGGSADIGLVRRRRIHSQATLGGIIEMAGWGEENREALLGVLLAVKRGLESEKKVRAWRELAEAHAAKVQGIGAKRRTTKRSARKM